MGLERVAAVLQGKISNYETDLLLPIIHRGAELFGNLAYGSDPKIDTALRIAADHARATAFLIHDGVLPSNEGRGYVLRKIMRRAMRHARMVGVEEPYLYELTGFVAELMRPGYPELMESVQRVARVVKDEEHRYTTTFLVAEKMFNDEVKSLANGRLPGAVAFKLYDTYGLALDEQEDMARERGLEIDREGFEREMDEQRRRARASWKGAEKGAVPPAYQALLEKGRTRFVGYEHLETHARVIGLLVDHQIVDRIDPGMHAEMVLDETPFYAETGGQVGDQGALYSETGQKLADVETTYPAIPGLSVHRIVAHAPIAAGDELWARVNDPVRHATMRNHTATHLLHAALRKVLGLHVKQAGSVVAPDRLRFDFTHYTAMDHAEIEEIERLMNHEILENIPVDTEIIPLDIAVSTGAMALFGEKYGDRVRVVSIPDFSKELCGGTHVARTGDIGVCKVVHESSISAGVRRIEAITGERAVEQYQHSTDTLKRIAEMMKVSEPELVEHVEKMLARERNLEKQVDQLKNHVAQSAVSDLEGQARTVGNVRILAARVDGMDRQQLRALADSLRNKWKTAVVVLASAEDSNVAIVSAVTKDLTSKVHAGKLVGTVAQAVGGKGGGRPDMAEGGGKDPSALPAALERVYDEVESKL
jgi:alanyl-tRNA synthetase